MPIPDTPQTRQEQYLNAIATGDASGIPDTPQCRQEQYLDAIAKNGGGGGSGGGALVVTVTLDGSGTNRTMNKTWKEIYDALCNGNTVVARYTDDNEFTFQDNVDTVIAVEEMLYKDGGDHFFSVTTTYLGSFNAESKDGYPTQEM